MNGQTKGEHVIDGGVASASSHVEDTGCRGTRATCSMLSKDTSRRSNPTRLSRTVIKAARLWSHPTNLNQPNIEAPSMHVICRAGSMCLLPRHTRLYLRMSLCVETFQSRIGVSEFPLFYPFNLYSNVFPPDFDANIIMAWIRTYHRNFRKFRASNLRKN